MAKTLAEYQAEELARKEAEEKRLAEERRREQMSWFGRIWDMIPDFSTLLLWGAILIGGYFLAKTEGGQQFLNGIFGKDKVEGAMNSIDSFLGGLLSKVGIVVDMDAALAKMPITEIRKNLLDKEVPLEIVDIIAKDKQVFDGFRLLSKEANGGKVNEHTFTNDKTVFALLTQKPEMAQTLAAAALKTSNGPMGKTTLEIVGSLKAIVSDDRLNVLLNPPHRENTVALLSALPIPNKGALQSMLRTEVIDGKATPALRNLLVAVLTPDANGKLPDTSTLAPAIGRFAQEASPQTRKDMLDAQMKPSASDTPLEAALKANNGGKAIATLRSALGDEKFVHYVSLASGVDELAKMKFALENRDAFVAFHKAADVAKLPKEVREPLMELVAQPPAATAPLLAIIHNGVDPRAVKAILGTGTDGKAIAPNVTALTEKLLTDANARATLSKAGVENLMAYAQTQSVNLPASVNANTLSAILTAADTIARNPKMEDATIKRDTVFVVQTIADMLVNDNPAALKKLKPEELAAFFNNHDNAAAIKALIEQTKDSLPSSQQAMAQALLAHWQTVERLAADKVGAEFLIEQMNKPKEKKHKDANSCKVEAGVTMGQEFGLWFKGMDILSGGKDNIIGKNIDGIKALKHDLDVADCLTLPARAVTTPTATRRGGHTVAPYVAQ